VRQAGEEGGRRGAWGGGNECERAPPVSHLLPPPHAEKLEEAERERLALLTEKKRIVQNYTLDFFQQRQSAAG